MTIYTGQPEQFDEIDELAYKYFCILVECEDINLNSLEMNQATLESLEKKCLKLAMREKDIVNQSSTNSNRIKDIWHNRKDNRFISYRHECSPAHHIID